jgi:oligopeptidase B
MTALKPGAEHIEGVLAGVPLVDAVTTSEYDKQGNPNNKEYYYMISYSSYDNMQERGYPAMLITARLRNSQVQCGEPAKGIVNRLRGE